MELTDEQKREREWLYETADKGFGDPETAREWTRRHNDLMAGLLGRQGGRCGLCHEVTEPSRAIERYSPTYRGELVSEDEYDGALICDLFATATAYAMCDECVEAIDSGDVEEIEERLRIRRRRVVVFEADDTAERTS